MDRTKLLKLMDSKPVASRFFRDSTNGKLYRSVYLGMGEHYALEASEFDKIITDLLSDGTLVYTTTSISYREMTMLKQADGSIKNIPTSSVRSGCEILPADREPSN